MNRFLSLEFLRLAANNPTAVRQDDAWLTHIRPILALVTIDYKDKTKLSMKSLVDFLRVDQSIGSHSGINYTTEHLRLIYKILGNNRSDIFKGSAIDKPQYSPAVPMGLLAYKEHYGIPYSKWELDSSFMANCMMGPALSSIKEVTEYLKGLNNGEGERYDSEGSVIPGSMDIFDLEVQRSLRESALLSRTIDPKKYTSIKRVKDPRLSTNALTKFYWCMITQTWIFDQSVRHRDMITNLLDWDTPAEPLDQLTVLKVENDEEDPW